MKNKHTFPISSFSLYWLSCTQSFWNKETNFLDQWHRVLFKGVLVTEGQLLQPVWPKITANIKLILSSRMMPATFQVQRIKSISKRSTTGSTWAEKG